MSETNRDLTDQFYHHFQSARSELSSRLETAKSTPSQKFEEAQALSLQLAKLRKELTDATSFLPTYDQSQCELQLKTLEQGIEELRASSAPKSKFSFKRKAANPSAPAASPIPSGSTPPLERLPTEPTIPSRNLAFASSSHAYLTLDTLTKDPSNVNASELTISDIDHCIINLMPSGMGGSKDRTNDDQPLFSTLHIRNVSDSVLLLSVVGGSVLLHDVHRCVVVVGCHQFRMHTSAETDVYLSIPSNPIIEHCSRIRFSAYPQSMSSPDYRPTSQDSKHLSVLDFSHIRATPSPNWSEIPVEAIVHNWPLKPTPGDACDSILEKLLPTVNARAK